MKTLVFCAALLTLALPSYGTTTTFTDNTFNLANYSESPLFKSNASASFTFDQCPTCGNPGQALQTISTLPNTGDFVAQGFVNNTFSYNPATQGAISTIDASVDKNIITNIPPGGNPGAGNTFRPLIEQDGIFYLAAISGPTFNGGTTGYLTLAQAGLVATDFTKFDFTTGTFVAGNPNFAGDRLLFGLAQRTQSGPANLIFEADYDNLNLKIHSVPDNGSTMMFLLSSAAAVLVARTYFARRPNG
jgi:hypothetical protein